MWLGTYNIPEVRLYPDILNDVKRFSLISPRIHDIDLDPKVLAKTLGLTPNSGAFYRRLNSSICYGLVEGRSQLDLHNWEKILPILRIITLEQRDSHFISNPS